MANNAYVRSTRARVERIVVLGLEQAPKSVTAIDTNGNATPLEFAWHAAEKVAHSDTDSSQMRASELVIRDPRVLIADDWIIEWK